MNMNMKVVKEVIKAQPKTFVLIIALVLSNVALYMYASAYHMPRLENLQHSWFEKRKSAAGGPALDSASVYRQGKDDLQTWRAGIIPKKAFARFVGSLFETAAGNSLAFTGVTYKTLQLPDENLVAYTMDFNVSGKYSGVKRFLVDIGRLREMMTIDNISLTSSKATEDTVALKVQLTVYLRPEEQ